MKIKYLIVAFFVLFGIYACAQDLPNDIEEPQSEQVTGIVDSYRAELHVGETVTVRIRRAYCYYRPDLDDKPTFCNDRPFPTQYFTMVVWNQNWSHLDGRCLHVYGKVELYEGKPDIVATSLNEVSYCP